MAFNQYILSPEESLRIFHNNIVPAELTPVLPHNHQTDSLTPLAVLIVGQTGAGKTRLSPVLLSAFSALGRTPAHFIADTYKAYHPSYLDIINGDKPHIASPATGTDARKWLTMACEYAADHRLDVLVESACRHADDFAGLVRVFREKGYRVCVAIMAVPKPLSRLGILVRFHKDLPEARSGRLPLRLTPRKVHDDSYAGLVEATRFVAEQGCVDEVVVVRRGNGVVYHDWRKEDGAFKGLVEVVDKERRRPLTEEEMEGARRDLELLEGMTGSKPEVIQDAAEIGAMIGELAKAAAADGEVSTVRTVPTPLNAVEFVERGLS
jgi:hypothetical protein